MADQLRGDPPDLQISIVHTGPVRVGMHLSIGKGLKKTAEMAVATGCQTLQIFSGSPTAWRSRDHDPDDLELFRHTLLEQDIGPVYVHSLYLVNLASPNPETWRKSIETLKRALQLAARVSPACVVTHLGSHVGTGSESGLERITEAVAQIIGVSEGPMLLFENSPGSRNEIGSYFEEIAEVLDRLASLRSRLGICLDTAHLWGAGYDLSTARMVDETLKLFDSVVGLDRLQGIHANDSTLDRGARRDIHTAPGQGQIGPEGFQALVRHPALADMNYILELPRLNDQECAPAVAQFKALCRET